jgi:hypothetical protein
MRLRHTLAFWGTEQASLVADASEMHARRDAAGDMAVVLPCVDESMTYLHRGALHFKAIVYGYDLGAANQLV